MIICCEITNLPEKHSASVSAFLYQVLIDKWKLIKLFINLCKAIKTLITLCRVATLPRAWISSEAKTDGTFLGPFFTPTSVSLSVLTKVDLVVGLDSTHKGITSSMNFSNIT